MGRANAARESERGQEEGVSRGSAGAGCGSVAQELCAEGRRAAARRGALAASMGRPGEQARTVARPDHARPRRCARKTAANPPRHRHHQAPALLDALVILREPARRRRRRPARGRHIASDRLQPASMSEPRSRHPAGAGQPPPVEPGLKTSISEIEPGAAARCAASMCRAATRRSTPAAAAAERSHRPRPGRSARHYLPLPRPPIAPPHVAAPRPPRRRRADPRPRHRSREQPLRGAGPRAPARRLGRPQLQLRAEGVAARGAVLVGAGRDAGGRRGGGMPPGLQVLPAGRAHVGRRRGHGAQERERQLRGPRRRCCCLAGGSAAWRRRAPRPPAC